MRRVFFPLHSKELSKLEKDRVKECRQKYHCKGYVYMVTSWCLGCGYDYIWSARKLREKTINLGYITDIEVITDLDELINKI